MEIHDELSNVEDAAIEAFNLAPRKFSWIKYEDQIDLRIVQYAIRDACKTDVKYLRGTSKHGYMLTQVGLNWAKRFDEKKQLSTTSRKMSPSDLIFKERIRLENTRAYKKFIIGEKEKITVMDFREFTRVNDYFPKHIREQRYEKIENTIKDDKDLLETWKFLKAKFSEE
jgi:hypothetical protein